MWSEIADYIKKRVESLIKEEFQVEVNVPVKDNSKFADFCIPLFVIAKEVNSDVETVKRVLSKIKLDCVKVEFVGGFMNFKVDVVELATKVLPEILSKGEDYGKENVGNGSKVIVEYVSANPLHPLHIGHSRNAFIGDALVNLYTYLGFNVEKHYYINDAGRQVAILVAGVSKLLDEITPPDDVKVDHWIGELYVKSNKMLESGEISEEDISALLQGIERGDPLITKQFDSIVDLCLKGQLETLKRLGISFDFFTKESRLCHKGLVKEVVDKLSKSKFYKKFKETEYFEKHEKLDEECDPEYFVLDLNELGIDKPLVLMRKDGTTLYVTRDIAYSIWKISRGVVKIFNVIAAEQTLPQSQLRAALKILGYEDIDDVLIHVKYEMVIAPELGKMSSRRGRAIWLDDIIELLIEEIKKSYPQKVTGEIAEKVAIAAIKCHMLKVDPMKPLTFKVKDVMNLKANSGPYLLYTLVRAKNILRKAGKMPTEANYEKLTGKEEGEIIKLLSKFPDVVKKAALEIKPNILVDYLLKLPVLFNKLYEKKPVLKAPKEERDARLHLVKATEVVLSIGLKLLGIPILERM